MAMLAMFHPSQNLPLRGMITFQRIVDSHSWDVLIAFEKLTAKLLGSLLVASTLEQHVEDVALRVHGAPEIMALTVDGEKHVIATAAQVRC
jgi:hypothetical protein